MALCNLVYLYPGFVEKFAGQFRIEGRRHGEDRQVLGADAPVLPTHMTVQTVPRLGNCTAQNTSIIEKYQKRKFFLSF